MRWIVLGLFLALRHTPLYAQGCDIGDWTNIADPILTKDADDTLIFEVPNFPLEKNDVTLTMCKDKEIVRFNVVDKKLQFFTKSMREWEESVENQASIIIECFHVQFECDKELKKTINLKIEDTNNYDPRFVDEQGVEKTLFEIILPMPFPATMSLDSFGSSIFAKDEDYTETSLIFSITNSENLIDIKYANSIDPLKKVHKSSLVSKVPLDFEEMKFDLNVKDKYGKEGKAKLVIKKNPDVSLVVPEFDKSYYMGKYDKNGLSTIQDKITLKNGKSVKIALEGAYAKFFETEISDDKITIIQKEPLVDVNNQNVIFTMKATNLDGQSDEATVIIEPIATNLPKFEKSYYLGNLDIDSRDMSHDTIQVEADVNAKIDITEKNLKEIFATQRNGQTVKITLLPTANIENIKEAEIIIPLQITNDDGGVATTIVVLKVTRKAVVPITFSKTNYQGELNVDTNVIGIEDIKITEGEADAVEIIEEEYKSKFDVTIDPITKIISLKVKDKLEMVDEPGLILTLKVSNKKGQSSETTVVLKFTGNTTEIKPINFEKLFYKGEIDTATENIHLDEILIKEGDVKDVKIVETEYKDFFQAKLSEDKKGVTIKLAKKLPPIKESSIVLVLEASNDQSQIGRTTVILEVADETVQEIPITFGELFYKGNLKTNPEGVELVKAIEITKGDVKTVQIVDGEYKDLFQAKLSEDKKGVTIELAKKLPPIKEASIVLVLEASNDQSQIGRTTVILEVADETVQEIPITFGELFYKGNLKTDPAGVELVKAIQITKGDVNSVTIVDGEHKEFFEAKLSEDKKGVTIEVVKTLPQIDDASIVLTIEATNDKNQVGKTIVILEVEHNLPEDDSINFMEQLYKGELNVKTQEITLNTIKIDTGDVKNVKILGEYENLFKVEYDENTKIVSLTVIGNLETINEPNVVFTLAAYNAKNDMGQTTVVLTVVGDLIKPTPPTFEKTYYEGEFKIEDQSLDLEDIRITDGNIESVIIVEKDYNTYFEAKYNKDTQLVEIIKLKDLENIMESNIVFSLEASDNYGQSSDSTVVLKVLGKAEPEEDKIVFDEHEIGFTVEEKEVLPKVIGQFVAKSTNNKDKITYGIVGSSPTGLKLNEDTGAVSVIKILTDTVLPVKLVATGSDSKKTAETDFVIYSYKLQENSGEKAKYSYIAKKVKEGDETQIILQQQNTDYKYCLLDINPIDDKISVNQDGYLVSNELDREDSKFENVIVPQYLVTVDLIKKAENCEPDKKSRMQKDIVEQINMYNEIENWESRTVVTVLIEDENDNDPIFDPSQQFVAYPKEEIAKIIRPMYLTKVHATDLDSEDNFGKITYSSTSDNVFVNEDSGIIYPTDNVFSSDDFVFTVIATDGGGKTDELEVKVSIIDKDKISIISFENIDVENVGDKLKELSDKSGINLQALSISAVPVETSMLFKDNSYYAQAYVYGVKDDKIVSSNTIKENIEDVTVIEFNPNASDGCDAEIEECDDSGLIAAVAVLAVLLAVVLAGSIAFYVVKLRNRNASSNDFDPHNDAERIIEKSAVPEMPNNRRSTGYVFNPPPPEDDDVDSNSNNNEKIGDDFDRNLERRKSVSFNDQIETIKIDKTVPAEETEDSDATKKE